MAGRSQPVNVLVDTSVLTSLSANHVLVGCIHALAQQRRVTVYVPRVVRDEYRTQVEERERASIEACLKALKDLPRRTYGASVTALKADLEEAKNRCAAAAVEKVTALLDRLGAIELPAHPDDLTEALDAYFSGTGPVRTVKNREDIPDALIWAAAKRLARDVGHVQVLVKDGRLYDACRATDALSPHKSLNALLLDLPSELVKWAVTSAPIEWVSAVEKFHSDLVQIVSDRLGDALWGRQCWIDLRPGTATWEQFGDAFIGDVTGGKVLGDITFNANAAEIVGGRYISVPFEAVVEVEVEVYPGAIYVGPQYEVEGTLATQANLDEHEWDRWRMTPEKLAASFDRDIVDIEVESFDYHNVEQVWRPR